METGRKSRQQLLDEITDLQKRIKELVYQQPGRKMHPKADAPAAFGQTNNLLENIADSVLIFDQETFRFLYVNRAAVAAYGYTREEFLTMTPHDLHSADQVAVVDSNIKDHNSRTPNRYIHLTKSREKRPVETHTSEIVYQGRPAWITTIRDMSARLRAEEELRDSEERFRSITEQMTEAVFLTDPKGEITYMSPLAIALFGYQAEEMEHCHFTNFLTTDSIARAINSFTDTLQKGVETNRIKLEMVRKDGTVFIGELAARVYLKHGVTSGTIGVIRDVTAGRLTEKALVKSEEKYRTALRSVPDAMLVCAQKDGRMLEMSDGFTRMFGYPRDEALGKTVFELGLYLNPESGNQVIRSLQANHEASEFQFTFCKKDGTTFEGLHSARRISFENEPCMILVIKDVTYLVKTQRALEESEERYRLAMELTPDPIMIHRDGEIIFANQATLDLLGMESSREIEGKYIWGFNSIDEDVEVAKERVRLMNAGHVTPWREYDIRRPDGSDLVVEAKGRKIPFPGGGTIITVWRDLTERKKSEEERRRLESQLRQSQKMDAIGQLAGGIAHDFNNMLGGIMGAAEMLSSCIKGNTMAAKYQTMILDAAERAAGLTSKLLTFSRDGVRANNRINLHRIIDETVVLLENTIDRRIEIKLDLAAESCTVVGDPSQLQNVFLNMGINSSQAMPDGGEIYFSTQVVGLDKAYCKASPFELNPGEYISIEIRDTGIGIDMECLPKIFEPFFTTKEPGKGTGLGLAAAYGTVKQHHGSITVYSQIGVGTSFNVLLPLTESDGMVKPMDLQEYRGSGCILVVDDEEFLRETARAILENLGYEVALAKNGRDALQYYRKNSDNIDLVILDMVMPVMNGRDCFKALKEFDPEVCVLLSSGFSREEDLVEMRSMGLKGFVRKPYRGAVLGRMVYDTLNNGSL
jgi:PAS domain S-box-containing protein